MVSQSLARLRETEPGDFYSQFNSLGGTKSAEAQPPTEIIMICFDTSQSMNGDADFIDMNRSPESAVESEEPTLLPKSGIKWSIEDAQGTLIFR